MKNEIEKNMIMKIEYFMLHSFSNREFYSIEYKDGNYYFSNNLMINYRLKKEVAENIVQSVLGNLSILYKEATTDAIIDKSEGYIKVLRADGSKEVYSSNDYYFKAPRAYLMDLNSRIMRLDI